MTGLVVALALVGAGGSQPWKIKLGVCAELRVGLDGIVFLDEPEEKQKCFQNIIDVEDTSLLFSSPSSPQI